MKQEILAREIHLRKIYSYTPLSAKINPRTNTLVVDEHQIYSYNFFIFYLYTNNLNISFQGLPAEDPPGESHRKSIALTILKVTKILIV